MNLSSSLEDYLEAIFDLKYSKGIVRITDLGLALKVEKSSVNFAVTKLKNLHLVNHEKYEDIKLTPKGEKEARRIKNRHNTIKDFFKELMIVPEKDAESDACRIEHVISSKSFKQLSLFMKFIKTDKKYNIDDIKKSFAEFAKTNQSDSEE